VITNLKERINIVFNISLVVYIISLYLTKNAQIM